MACANIPTCFFPTTVLFIAHNQYEWLKPIIKVNMSFTSCVVDSFSAALVQLNQQGSDIEQLSGLCNDHSFVAHQAPGVVDPNSETLVMIHAEMYNPQRFAEISVIVLDGTDSTENVFDFCHSLNHHASKKIVIINSDQLNAACNALAKGWIDAYIQKDNPDLHSCLIENIDRLQENYFQYMSKIVLKLMDLHEPKCLSNPDFVSFFQSVCVQHGIVEYYLIDVSGGFLLVNAEGKVSILLIKRESDIPSIAEFAAKHGASSAIVMDIESGAKIPGILAQEYNELATINWDHLLVPAEHKVFNDAYEIAYIDGHAWYDANYHKLCSYRHYLNEIHAADCLLPN